MKETRWRAVVTKCDERAKKATKFGNVFIIENRRKSEAAKVEVLLYLDFILIMKYIHLQKKKKQYRQGHSWGGGVSFATAPGSRIQGAE
jgi:hypothetical protein